MTSPRLVCLGNLTLDDVVLPDGREMPDCIGGDAFYAGLAARLTEPSTEIATPVGSDLPETVVAALRAARFSTAALPPRPLPTLHNRVVYDRNGDRQWTLFASESDFEALSPLPRDLPPAFRRAEAFLVLAMALRSQERLVEWMRSETKALVALDPQEDYIAGNEARLTALIAQAHVFLPSAEEVRRILGHSDWRRAAETFSVHGPDCVVVKLGAAGVLVHDSLRRETFRMPAFPTSPVDTTGAGDAFCGAFVASLLTDPHDLVLAARRGSVAASFAISDFGAMGIMAATADMAEQRLREWQPEVSREA